MVTFPYPYMNGRMHLGHVYSQSKAEFFACYKRIRDYNVLFTFLFHCTCMPICALAKKLQEQIETHGKTELRANMEKNIELRKILPMDKQPKMSQYEILSAIRVEDEEIHKFTDPRKWTEYFPHRGVSDLKALGVMVDWRRSFITTDINPYNDSLLDGNLTDFTVRILSSLGKDLQSIA